MNGRRRENVNRKTEIASVRPALFKIKIFNEFLGGGEEICLRVRINRKCPVTNRRRFYTASVRLQRGDRTICFLHNRLEMIRSWYGRMYSVNTEKRSRTSSAGTARRIVVRSCCRIVRNWQTVSGYLRRLKGTVDSVLRIPNRVPPSPFTD